MFALKFRPEDFCVAEVVDFPVGHGPYAVYRMTKMNLGALEAMAGVREMLRVPHNATAMAGLKDKVARTVQTITVLGGPPRNFSHGDLALEHIGQAERPIVSPDLVANDFRVVVRDLTPEDADALLQSADLRGQQPFPNYFDDQRFGSRNTDGRFVAEAWCRGEYEDAVHRAIAEPNVHDRPADRNDKRMLARCWGEFQNCGPLADPERWQVVDHLVRRRGDFRGAIARLSIERRSLLLAAFQSWIWNRLLESVMRDGRQEAEYETVRIGEQPFRTPKQTPADFVDAMLPYPAARQPIESPAINDHLTRILAEFRLERRQLRVKYPRDSFFSKGARRAFTTAQNCRTQMQADALHPGRKALTISFRLPPGCYATLFIKVLAAHANTAIEPAFDLWDDYSGGDDDNDPSPGNC